MGAFDVPDLCVVFPALHQDFRILLFDNLHPGRDVPVKRIVHPVRIQQDPRPFRKHGDCPVNPVVRFHDDALFFKRSKDAVREFIPIGKKFRAVFKDQQIRKNKRTICNIVPSQIQKPGDIVQTGQQMHAGACFLHLPADTGKF